jgi:hypothetical protein
MNAQTIEQMNEQTNAQMNEEMNKKSIMDEQMKWSLDIIILVIFIIRFKVTC